MCWWPRGVSWATWPPGLGYAPALSQSIPGYTRRWKFSAVRFSGEKWLFTAFRLPLSRWVCIPVLMACLPVAVSRGLIILCGEMFSMPAVRPVAPWRESELPESGELLAFIVFQKRFTQMLHATCYYTAYLPVERFLNKTVNHIVIFFVELAQMT